jgi:hypothetical protein
MCCSRTGIRNPLSAIRGSDPESGIRATVGLQQLTKGEYRVMRLQAVGLPGFRDPGSGIRDPDPLSAPM